MLQFLADENFNNEIVRGLMLRAENLDLVRVQEVGLRQLDDRTILDWAAKEGRILLTHDRATMSEPAYQRVMSGQTMPGVFILNDRLPIGRAIDEILLIAECSQPDDWRDQVIYLPL